MRTVIRTNIKDNTFIYIKEKTKRTLELLVEKGNYILVTKIKYNNLKKVISEKKVILKKSTILMVDQVI